MLYGAFPPLTTIFALPSFPPLQLTKVVDEFTEMAVGEFNVIDSVPIHPVGTELSVTVTVYVPGVKPVAGLVV